MEILQEISKNISNEKLEKVKDNKFFEIEINLLQRYEKIKRYYKYIIENIELDKNNTNNSYIMWICNKVNNINMSIRCNIKEGRVSLPDIDIDFPIAHRDEVYEYIKNKHGYDKVNHICTFGGLQGKAALKEVCRVYDACDSKTMDRMTRAIPDEGRISDKLEETKESSILRYVLKYEPQIVKDYCTMDEAGNLVGDYAKYFKQAIKIEGTYKSIGKHAAGVVISGEPLINTVPMMEDRVAMEMNAIESLGLTKMDLLGIASLDKLMKVNKLLMTGKM